MKKNIAYLFTLLIMVSIGVKIFASASGQSGKSGAPGEGTCTSCHGGASTGNIAITHNIPAGGYVLGTTYTITVTVTQTSISLFGFDCTILTSSNTNAGTIVVTNSTQTRTLTSGVKTNITHRSNGGTGTGSHAFQFNWTAPATNIGNVTIYATGLAANGNNGTSGDFTYATSLVITPSASATSIATGAIAGSPFCNGQTGISIPYTATGTYTTGNIFTAQLSSSTGSFTTPTIIGTVTSTTSGSITSNIPIPNTAGTAYRVRVVSSTPATTGTDNGTNLTVNICATTYVTTGTISGSPFCDTQIGILIPYNAVGTYTAGNVFTAQLSDATGSFSFPLNIGSLTAITSGVITSSVGIPAIAGTQYRIRVVANTPVITGTDNGVNLAVRLCYANSITTSVISGSPFCENSSFNVSVPFNFTGTFTGNYTAQLSDANGSFANALTIGTGTTSPILAIIPSNTAKGTAYRIRVVNNNPNILGTDNGANLSVNTCNAVLVDTIWSGPYCTSTTYNCNVPFKIIGTSTGPFIAELSDASGNFTNATTIGYGYNPPIAAVIPEGTSIGSSYRVRVRDMNTGFLSSANTNNFRINTCLNTDVNDISFDEAIRIYPNPNNGVFEIMFTNTSAMPISIGVYNLVGELLQEIDSTKIQSNSLLHFDNSSLKSGIYFLRMQSNEKVMMKKILIHD